MKPMSMEYSVASTTVADDYEDNGMFQATPIAIEKGKVATPSVAVAMIPDGEQ